MPIFLRLLVFAVLASFMDVSFAEGNANVGKQKAAPCASCHGANGNSASPMFPRLAGQHIRYLVTQLNAFKTKIRPNEMMQAMASGLSEQDIEDISAYYVKQKPKFTSDEEQFIDEDEEILVTPKLILEGKILYRGGNANTGVAACIACHGPTGRGNEPAGFPVLTGQHAAYIAEALLDFSSGERNNDMSAMMQMIARKMTREEINAVSAYISSIR